MDPIDAGFLAITRLILVRLTNLVRRRYQKYSRQHKVTVCGQMVRKPRKSVKPQLVFTAYQMIPDRLKHISCNDPNDLHGVWCFFACQKYHYQGQVFIRGDKITVAVTTEMDSTDIIIDLADPACIDRVVGVFKATFPVSDPSCPATLMPPYLAQTRARGRTAPSSK